MTVHVQAPRAHACSFLRVNPRPCRLSCVGRRAVCASCPCRRLHARLLTLPFTEAAGPRVRRS